MPTGDMKPGDVTNLGALRPGDVGEYAGGDDPFIVTKSDSPSWVRIEYADGHCSVKTSSLIVRYLGPGRLEPARIVMRDEPGPLSALRELEDWKASQLKVESEWDEQEVGRLLKVPLGHSIRAAIQPGIENLQRRVAELEGQVGELRDGCEQIAKHIVAGDEDIAQYLAYDLIAATEPKGEP